MQFTAEALDIDFFIVYITLMEDFIRSKIKLLIASIKSCEVLQNKKFKYWTPILNLFKAIITKAT